MYVGNSGGELGVRGWVTALDEGSGKLLWRAYATGPDADVLIGPQFKPFYADAHGKDLGVSSWPAQAWKIGGGGMWGWITYDAELGMLYHGTANPGPWNADQRPGDNKWTAGIFARDPNTGDAHWFYRYSPHDEHDYDGINEQILLDMPFGGKMRKVLVHLDRDGYVYVIDRTNGEVLSADPFGPVNSTKGIDLATGRPILNPDKETKLGQTVRNICPTASGAKDWNPSSFSPQTGLLYIPHENMCMDWMSMQVSYIEGTPYVGAEVHMKPGPGGNRGVLTAWDPVERKPVWEVKENFPVWSGTVATGGDLVFYGSMDGWFKAVNAKTGELAWRYKVDSGIISQPVSYRGPDGHQYIAVLCGVGGWSGAVVSGPDRSARRFGRIRNGECHVGSTQVHHRRRHAICVFAAALNCCLASVLICRLPSGAAAAHAVRRIPRSGADRRPPSPPAAITAPSTTIRVRRRTTTMPRR